MRKHMFDNIMKVYRANVQVLANVVQSVEMDLELPRGYIAKIKKVIFHHDFKLSGVGDNEFLAALVRDPDDDETTAMPAEDAQHDVVADCRFGIANGTLTTGTSETGNNGQVIVDFDQELDVVSARNLRFNAVAVAASPTLGLIYCEMYYTLEKVSDELILDLLDIL